MFRFEHTEYLWAFFLVPLFIILFLNAYQQVRKKRRKLADNRLFNRLIPDWSELHIWIRFSLVLLILISLVISLSNPQWATKREKVKAMSSDIFIALDISQSMMVQDIPPNRLERAKKLAENLIINLKGNRIGLIFFAGEAFIQMPLTSDYAAALMFLKSANPEQIEAQGTSIVEALDVADRSFPEDRDHQRAMIIITDGEDHDGEAIQRALSAKEEGLTVFTFGVGTAEGGFVPYTNRMGVETYKTDANGNYIKSRVNIELLDAIASSGGGKYYSVLNGESSIQNLVDELERIEKIEIEQRSFTSYESYFQYFLLVAIILLVLEIVLPEKGFKIVKSEE